MGGYYDPSMNPYLAAYNYNQNFKMPQEQVTFVNRNSSTLQTSHSKLNKLQTENERSAP